MTLKKQKKSPKEKPGKKRPAGINDVLRKSLTRYFALLDGQPPAHLHAMVMGEVEKVLLEHTMKSTDCNQTRAACILGISRATLRKKLAHHKISGTPPVARP